jgi:hypothetical protein
VEAEDLRGLPSELLLGAVAEDGEIGGRVGVTSCRGTWVSASPRTKTRPMTVPGETGMPFTVCIGRGVGGIAGIGRGV